MNHKTVELLIPALDGKGVYASLNSRSAFGFGANTQVANVMSQRIALQADAGNAAEVVREALLTLSQRTDIRNADLKVQVADSHAVLEVVRCEISDVLSSKGRQLQRLAEVAIAEVIGEKASNYDVRWYVQPDNEHLFICALPRVLISGITSAAQAYGLKLVSIEPQFSQIWNASLGQLKQTMAPQAVFLRASENEAVLGCVRNGVITQISQAHSLKAHVPVEAQDSHNEISQHVSTMSRLDSLVDRLLTALGEDPSQAWRYFASSQGLSRADFSPRWQMLA